MAVEAKRDPTLARRADPVHRQEGQPRQEERLPAEPPPAGPPPAGPRPVELHRVVRPVLAAIVAPEGVPPSARTFVPPARTGMKARATVGPIPLRNVMNRGWSTTTTATKAVVVVRTDVSTRLRRPADRLRREGEKEQGDGLSSSSPFLFIAEGAGGWTAQRCFFAAAVRLRNQSGRRLFPLHGGLSEPRSGWAVSLAVRI